MKVSIIVTFCLVLSLAIGAFGQSDRCSSIVITDFTGNQNQGNLRGSAYVSGENCYSGSCLTFAGSKSSSLKTGGSVIPINTADMTFAAYIRPSVAELGETSVIIDAPGIFKLQLTDNIPTVVVKQPAGGFDVTVTSATALSTTSPTHIAFSVEDDDQLILYINGNVAGSSTFPSDDLPQVIPRPDITIGNSGVADGTYSGFRGMMDNVAFFARTLTPQDIQKLRGGGYPVGAQFYFTFDDSDDTRVAMPDASGRNNHGTLFGADLLYVLKGMNSYAAFTGKKGCTGTGAIRNVLTPSFQSNQITVSAFISAVVSDEQVIVANWFESLSQHQFFTFAINNRRQLILKYSEDGTASKVKILTASAVIPLSTWTHVAFSITASKAIKLYINGKVAAVGSWFSPAFPTAPSAYPLYVGNQRDIKYTKDVYIPAFLGKIDNLAVYSSALTDDEVLLLATKASADATLVSRPTLQGFYLLNGAPCPNLTNPKDGSITYSSTPLIPGVIVSYNCSYPYRVIGDESRVCALNGRWSSFTPICGGEIPVVNETAPAPAPVVAAANVTVVVNATVVVANVNVTAPEAKPDEMRGLIQLMKYDAHKFHFENDDNEKPEYHLNVPETATFGDVILLEQQQKQQKPASGAVKLMAQIIAKNNQKQNEKTLQPL